jgi:hypothetical protein
VNKFQEQNKTTGNSSVTCVTSKVASTKVVQQANGNCSQLEQ